MLLESKRIIGIIVTIVLLLLIPLVAMQFTDEVHWALSDFLIMGTVLLAMGFAYELIARRSEKMVYRVAFGVGLMGAFLLFWVNGAVGIIGSEDQPANYLYAVVFIVGLVGSFLSRFKAPGMSRTLFVAAIVQLIIPVLALIVWPQISWGAAGILGVFFFNSFFALLFVVSGLLFRQAGD